MEIIVTQFISTQKSESQSCYQNYSFLFKNQRNGLTASIVLSLNLFIPLYKIIIYLDEGNK